MKSKKGIPPMDIIEKAESLKELAKHLGESPEANLLAAALALVDALAKEVVGLKEELNALTEQVDDIEDALDEIAEDVYGEDEDETFEVECPNCGELIQVDEGILEDGSIVCPGCDETLEFELGCDCGDCEDCDHEHE
jgi:hypothetical protein